MKLKLITLLVIITTSIGFAQNRQQSYFQGYTEEVSGKRFGYHSPFPEVNTSLLIRGEEDYAAIEWKTETVPKNYANKFNTLQ